MPLPTRLLLAALVAASAACGRMEQSSRARPGDGAIIYQSTILTMDPRSPSAEAVIVKDGVILDVGRIDDLVQAYPGAAFDERFLRRTLLPALVDVRLEANALNVIETPCQGGLLAEEISSLGSQNEQARVIAGGPAALAAAIDAVERIPDQAARKKVTIEARGPVNADAAKALTGLGVALVLSGEPMAAGCEPAADGEGPSAAAIGERLAGLIAIAPASGEPSLIIAAAGYLSESGPIRLSPQEALEAITTDAAYALGAEATRGVIAKDRRAILAVLDRNPLATPAEGWGGIAVETIDLSPAE